jgi:hypothetical protein
VLGYHFGLSLILCRFCGALCGLRLRRCLRVAAFLSQVTSKHCIAYRVCYAEAPVYVCTACWLLAVPMTHTRSLRSLTVPHQCFGCALPNLL